MHILVAVQQSSQDLKRQRTMSQGVRSQTETCQDCSQMLCTQRSLMATAYVSTAEHSNSPAEPITYQLKVPKHSTAHSNSNSAHFDSMSLFMFLTWCEEGHVPHRTAQQSTAQHSTALPNSNATHLSPARTLLVHVPDFVRSLANGKVLLHIPAVPPKLLQLHTQSVVLSHGVHG